MSCPTEETLSFYADGELPLGQVRSLESHLVGCRRCRASVLALRDEIGVLGDLLEDRDPGGRRADAPRERARGLAVGVGPALGVAALIVTTLGWLLERSLPPGTSWLSPVRVMGAYEMTLETIFMLRDQVPGLVETALTQGALFAVAAILLFLVSTLEKRLTRTAGVALLAALGTAGVASTDARAFELRHGEERVVIAAGETVSQSLAVGAEDVRIEGRLEGDLVAMAKRIRVSGEVTGSVLAIGDDVEIEGRVGGTLLVAGGVVRLEGEVVGPLYGVGEDFSLNDSARVGGDTAAFGERVRVEGRVARDLLLVGDWVELRGHVGRNLLVRGEDAALVDGAHVGGDVDARLREGNELEVSPGATIVGERTDVVLDWEERHRRSRYLSRHFYMANLVLLVSAFIVGMLAHLVRPALFAGGVPTTTDFLRELGIGFVTLVVVPVAIVICFATVVGIPVGVIGLFGYVTGLFLSMIVVAGLVGQAILGQPGDSRSRFGAALLLGLVIVAVVVNLPFVGALFRLLALMTGAGMLVTHAIDAWRVRAI